MSVLCCVRARASLCLAAIATLGVLVFAPTAGAAKIGSTYLALGDSLAYGFHAAQFAQEFPNFKPETFIGVVVIWLIARACRYVFAGR